MSACKRYRIGEFARLAATSIKTLRFYDALGLLRPVEVDVRSRYRYYDAAQLRDFAAIRALQDLGASLEDIRRVGPRSDEGRERRQLLIRLRTAALHKLDNARRSLDWIDLELEGGDLPLVGTPVVLKQRSEMRIASIRARLHSYDDIAPVERRSHAGVAPREGGRTAWRVVASL